MTLTEALHTLHRAGRIRSPWLPGMSYAVRLGALVPAVVRPVEAPPDTFLGVPDLTDPATVGGLLALLREATGRPSLCIDVHYPHDPVSGRLMWSGTRWCASDPADDWEGPYAPTEGEAIAAPLIALAGA